MKKLLKFFIPLIICLAALLVIRNCINTKVTLYNVSGEEIQVEQSEVEAQINNGYYPKPVQLVYAPNGKSVCIYKEEFTDYSNVGWFSQPPLMIYSPAGRKIYIEPDKLEEYLANGYCEEPEVTLYSANGEDFIAVRESEVAAYVGQGWLTEPPEREGLIDLFAQIESYVMGRNGNWGVFVQNMATNEYLVLRDQQYSGASLIKLFNMAAVYNQVHNGALQMTDKIKDQLRQMITISSNSAFNYLTQTIGGGNTSKGFDVENAHTAAIGCTSTTHSSELVEYDGYKAFYKGNNRTSPRDCGRVLAMIYKGKLVSPEASAEMLELLKNQTRRWKIPSVIPEGVVVANKTGETNTVEADAAIVYSPGADYVICIIGNGDVRNGIATIRDISGIVYNYFNPA